VSTRTLAYRLGRNCTLTIDGTVLQSVTDASLRERVVTLDCTGGANTSSAEIVVRRDLIVEFALLDFDESQYLDGKVTSAGADPIVEVSFQGGHKNRIFLATLHDSSEDQPLRDAVQSSWTLKRWGQRTI
jgi:hypothetical protein